MPQVSESGKYWIKMRFMGKERLVEIDDTMPCDKRKKLLLPRTVNNFEIWPALLLKAFFKLHTYKWFENGCYDKEVGDG